MEAAKRRLTVHFRTNNVDFEMMSVPQAHQADQQQEQEPTRPSPVVTNTNPSNRAVLETIAEELEEDVWPGPRAGDRTRW